MRVGVDGRELTGHRTGVGRYLIELLRAWLEAPGPGHHRFLLYIPRSNDPLDADLMRGLGPVGPFELVRVGGAPTVVWEQVALPIRASTDSLDVFFAPGYSAPLLLGVPIVLTLHDISFVVHPEWFPWREGLRRRTLARLSARRAAAVVTVSATMRDEVVRVLGLPADRVHAVHSGLRRLTCSGDTARTAPHEPLVLFAGSVLNRRNLPDLIGAFARVVIREPGARLEIIGDNRTHPYQDLARLAEAAGVGARVALRSFVPDAALSDAYGRARVFVFLSDYEGFGFTPLEALAAGVPVVVQDTPVAREILGDAACFVRRGDLTGTAAAILRMLQDESARADQLARAAAVLGRYRWDRAARETLAVLTAAAGS